MQGMFTKPFPLVCLPCFFLLKKVPLQKKLWIFPAEPPALEMPLVVSPPFLLFQPGCLLLEFQNWWFQSMFLLFQEGIFRLLVKLSRGIEKTIQKSTIHVGVNLSHCRIFNLTPLLNFKLNLTRLRRFILWESYIHTSQFRKPPKKKKEIRRPQIVGFLPRFLLDV